MENLSSLGALQQTIYFLLPGFLSIIFFDSKKQKLTPIKETISVLLNGNAIVSVEKISDQESEILYLGKRQKKK